MLITDPLPNNVHNSKAIEDFARFVSFFLYDVF